MLEVLLDYKYIQDEYLTIPPASQITVSVYLTLSSASRIPSNLNAYTLSFFVLIPQN